MEPKLYDHPINHNDRLTKHVFYTRIKISHVLGHSIADTVKLFF